MNAFKLCSYFLCIVPIFVVGLFKGDQCETENLTGKCLKIDDCNYALNLLKRNQRPQHCGFQNNTPIVCCLTSSEKTGDVSINKTTGEKKTSNNSEQCETEGLVGTCVQIHNCNYALNLLRKNKRPQYCGTRNQVKTVCCPTTLAEAENDTVGNKSSIKCMEYVTYYPPKKIPLIVGYGGEPSDAKEFPHMAILGYGNLTIKWLCGGTLISNQFILTAAHCTESPDYGQVSKVRLGELDINATNDDASPEDFVIAEIFEHPDFKPPSRYNDIALIKLDRKVKFDVYIRPACLYPFSEAPAYGLVQTGWGQTNYYGPTSSRLIKVKLDYIPHKKCAERYEHISSRQLKYGINEETQTCAGAENGRDACPGDSGGPLQVMAPILKYRDLIPYYSVVAITSFGQTCGFENSVGVYTKVGPYISWIEEIVWPGRFHLENSATQKP